MIPVEKIFEAVKAQAEQGSCKTCRWCFPVDDTLTRQCVIQGNFNPIMLDAQAVERESYPTRCDEGIFGTDSAPIYECLAYQPSIWSINPNSFGIVDAVDAHRDFMTYLKEAIYIYGAIRNNTLAKLTAKLNEAKESLPAVLCL